MKCEICKCKTHVIHINEKHERGVIVAIDKNQLKALIESVLTKIDMKSSAAVNLLLGTAAQESGLGTYIKQRGNGPACGIFQMEPETESDIWKNYLYRRFNIADKIFDVSGVEEPSPFHLWGNLIYQIAITRVHYWRIPEPLPDAIDIEGLAEYWKQHYNTPKGKGTVGEFIENYERYVMVFKKIKH